jgi:hypothetical protein
MKNKLLFFYTLSLPLLFSFIQAIAQNIPDFLVNEQVSLDGSEQATPNIAGDGKGNYVITWRDNRNGTDNNIFAQIFLNDGTPLSNNFIVNDDDGTDTQYGPAIAVDPNLNFVITWLDRRNGFEWDIYAQRFSNDGTALGSNFKVNDEPGNEEQECTTVSIDSCGNFVIVWTDEKSGDWDIYGQRYSSDGTALGVNFKINDDTGYESQYWPTSKGEKNGNFIVSWADKRYNNDWDIYAQRFAADGTALENNFKVNTDAGISTQLRPDIAIEENGNFIIAWGDYRNGNGDVYAQRYLSDGTSLGDNFKLNDDTPDTDQRNPTIAVDIAGNFTVCWGDDRNDYSDIYAQRFTSDATPIGINFKVNSGPVGSYEGESKISADENGNFLIIWKDNRFNFNGDIFAQSYLSDGTTAGDNFIVNDDVGSANQIGPSIAKDNNDNFIIAWIDSRNYRTDIYVQRFSSDGFALGSNILVNDEIQAYANYKGPSVSSDDAGNFVVAWVDHRIDYIGEIYAQRFSSDGSALGPNFKVNYLGAYVVYGAKVVCKKNGDFIIIWGDSDDGGKGQIHSQHLNEREDLKDGFSIKNKGSEPDIWAQQYLSDGTPLGPNFKVNDDVGNTDQTIPEIAIDSCGNFIIAWQDKRNGNWDIYAQRYLSDGTPLDSNIKVLDSLFVTYLGCLSISSDNAGNFVIAWKDDRNGNYDIWAQRYLNDGSPVGYNFLVNDDSGTTRQSYPRVSADGDGKFIITWNDSRNGNRDVYAQRYLSSGIPVGNNFLIPDTDELQQTNHSVILGSNRIYSVWQDNRGGQTGYDIWAKVLNWDLGVGTDENIQQEAAVKPLLYQNFPNPFRSFTEISYLLEESGFVTLYVYDLQGRKIKTLVNEFQSADTYTITFNGSEIENGICFYTYKVGNKLLETKKMILVK